LRQLGPRLPALRTTFQSAPIANYVVAFSDKHNDLSQWRAYGSPHVGYAISFRRAALYLHSGLILDKVLYDPDHQRSRLVQLANQFQVTGQTDPPLSLQNHLMIGSLFFKNPAFQVESEWRGVLVLPDHTDPKFQTSPLGLVPFIEVSFELSYDGQPMVGKVMVGPTSTPLECGSALKLLLDQQGYSAAGRAVDTCAIPHRSVH
jgi:hypothetical protein